MIITIYSILCQVWRGPAEHWPIRVFSFLLAISEVNCFLALKHFVFQDDMTIYLDFRNELFWSLINNPFLPHENSTASGIDTLNMDLHDIMTAPLMHQPTTTEIG